MAPKWVPAPSAIRKRWRILFSAAITAFVIKFGRFPIPDMHVDGPHGRSRDLVVPLGRDVDAIPRLQLSIVRWIVMEGSGISAY